MSVIRLPITMRTKFYILYRTVIPATSVRQNREAREPKLYRTLQSTGPEIWMPESSLIRGRLRKVSFIMTL